MRRGRPGQRRRSMTNVDARTEPVLPGSPSRSDIAAYSENAARRVLDAPEATLLDLVDRLLTKGVMASGDLTLGVAGIDLIYLRLSALLCAADRVLPLDSTQPPRRRRSARIRPTAARGAFKTAPLADSDSRRRGSRGPR
jgi:hypothetical protein